MCGDRGIRGFGRSKLLSVVVAKMAFATLAEAQTAPAPITVTSPAFKHGQPLPVDYTADGKNISPPIMWVSCLEITNPRPVPPYFRVVEPSA